MNACETPMAYRAIGPMPHAPRAMPSNSDSALGVGLLMPCALAVAAPRAMSFTTIRAHTPAAASSSFSAVITNEKG